MVSRSGFACHPYQRVATNRGFVGAAGQPPLQIGFVGAAHSIIFYKFMNLGKKYDFF